MRGRPPQPTNVKLLEGVRPSRVPAGEPVPSLRPVEPPYRLTKAVQAEWDRLAPDLISRQILTPWDTSAFALFCELLVLNRRAVQSARRGVLVKGARKDERVYNRAMQGVRETTQLLATLGSRFGWTPSDRARLTFPEMSDDELDELLS
jgi:P27 family predicted phage terminase small subunit